MYRIRKANVVEVRDGVEVVEAELFAQDPESLPGSDAFLEDSGQLLAAGSAALIPSESTAYVFDFDGSWKQWKK